MDPDKNRIPKNAKTVHLTAVCGTGMGSLAAMLKESGFEVTGSDQNVYPPMSIFLEERGIPVAMGYSPKNVAHRPDLVVVGNAVSADNPEVAGIRDLGLCYCSFPQALQELFAAEKDLTLVTGTHGKTTTTALLAWILARAGLDPGFLVGGIARDFGASHRLGKGGFMVVEGDEYDSAFFDKRPKFMHYAPSRTILTSVEYDHADIYPDFESVKRAFSSFAAGLPEKGFLVHHEDVPVEVVSAASCHKVHYGKRVKSVWSLGGVSVDPPWTQFEVLRRGGPYARYKTRLMGVHNLQNALAAIAVADDMGLDKDAIGLGLETFSGVRRRQEVRGVAAGVTVMDDFAHHPTAVRETLEAVRPHISGRLIAVFEPRTNTSQRKVFQDVYPDCFGPADLVVAARPPRQQKIAVEERFSSEKLVNDLKKKGKDARYFPDTGEIVDFLAAEAKQGDLLLIMSNGGFDNIHDRLLAALRGGAAAKAETA
ncbi:MAG: UDP-N-acetylmuramate:L-alanyl-gamma-D-glutamyl-meso-diaminopimelate ligase [Deltaproteobacteria bacterium]|nr:UDP-N-acetylmuramate:L-alanyl-gamma-D-glutamyl-meso-diaminopimelate ligase [Deltaproteobacteria bacterium]